MKNTIKKIMKLNVYYKKMVLESYKSPRSKVLSLDLKIVLIVKRLLNFFYKIGQGPRVKGEPWKDMKKFLMLTIDQM